MPKKKLNNYIQKAKKSHNVQLTNKLNIPFGSAPKHQKDGEDMLKDKNECQQNNSKSGAHSRIFTSEGKLTKLYDELSFSYGKGGPEDDEFEQELKRAGIMHGDFEDE